MWMVDVVSVGSNPTRIWGMTNRDRTQKISRSILADEARSEDRGVILVNDDYVVDPLLLSFAQDRPALLVVRDGVPVLAKIENLDQRAAIEAAMLGESIPSDSSIEQIRIDDQFTLYNRKLRKRVHPTVARLEPSSVRKIERDTYFGAYKGVTDILTKYLWPEWALVLTRLAAKLGVSPNQVTAIGLVFCIAATVLFWFGQFWVGMAAGLVFMVLDTVDGKLARCTITSSKMGSRFDHRIDQIHPPFWWLAWLHGLTAWGLELSPELTVITGAALVAGYIVDRVIERRFIKRHGFHVHVWHKVDSDFRLIGARRNPNMVILFFATLLGRPDIGIVAVAAWTVLSLAFHAVRSLQADRRRAKGEQLTSWLS
jgi:phosphatidylglycerophosphate synthase